MVQKNPIQNRVTLTPSQSSRMTVRSTTTKCKKESINQPSSVCNPSYLRPLLFFVMLSPSPRFSAVFFSVFLPLQLFFSKHGQLTLLTPHFLFLADPFFLFKTSLLCIFPCQTLRKLSLAVFPSFSSFHAAC